jgi:hypothetical protein
MQWFDILSEWFYRLCELEFIDILQCGRLTPTPALLYETESDFSFLTIIFV